MRLIFSFLFCLPLMAQEPANPEIFLFDIISEDNELDFTNGKNISNNPGYDNQPSFYTDEILLYSRTINGQTEIATHNINSHEEALISNTGIGSEYSPARIPGTKDIAAVRLDTTGLQRLYRYDWKDGESNLLHENLKIGYFAFYDENKILTTVLAGAGMDLVLLDLEKQTTNKIVSSAGRSLHKVPGTTTLSYTVVNDQKGVDLYLMNDVDSEPKNSFLTTLPPGVEDYVWLDKDRILAGQDNLLLMFDIPGESQWVQVADLADYKLQNISRLAVNASGDKVAIVAEIMEQ